MKIIKIITAVVSAVVLIALVITMSASAYYGLNVTYAIFSVFLKVGFFILAACAVFLLCSLVSVLQRREEREKEKDEKEEKDDKKD